MSSNYRIPRMSIQEKKLLSLADFPFFTTREVAKILDIPLTTMQYFITSNGMESLIVGRTCLFPKSFILRIKKEGFKLGN